LFSSAAKKLTVRLMPLVASSAPPCDNPQMIVMRESSYRAVPWKNGGGVTREILRVPPEPTAFDWRLSLATIASPGPFSAFDGYHRILVLVRGPGVELDFGQHGRTKLTLPGQMVSFDGAWQTSCTLLDGPSTDLNLIVSKERTLAESRSVQLAGAELIQTAQWPQTLVCCISGAVRLTNTAGEVQDLSGVDVARCSPSDGTITCSPRDSTPVRLFVAGLGPKRDH
jgi:environmental stress-induced protein Ves